MPVTQSCTNVNPGNPKWVKCLWRSLYLRNLVQKHVLASVGKILEVDLLSNYLQTYYDLEWANSGTIILK